MNRGDKETNEQVTLEIATDTLQSLIANVDQTGQRRISKDSELRKLKLPTKQPHPFCCVMVLQKMPKFKT